MKSPSTLLLAALLMVGCGKSQDAPPADGTSEKTAGDAAKAPEVSVTLADLESIRATVAKHKGKVVVMDAWATWCDPCIAEFPNLIELHKKYGPDKVACISLSFDDESEQAEVLKFLNEQGAHFQNLQKFDKEDLFTLMNIPALPAVFVYGKDGELVKMATGHEAYATVVPLVEQLVGDDGNQESGE